MTKESLVAEFELGGMDAVWSQVEIEIKTTRAISFDDGYNKRKQERQAISKQLQCFRRGIGRNVRIAFSVLVVCTLLAGGIYTIVHNEIVKGGREMAACSRGKTFLCQAAMQDEYYTHDNGSLYASPRGELYLTAYEQATGHDLPHLITN